QGPGASPERPPRPAPSGLPEAGAARWPTQSRPGYDDGPGPPPRSGAVRRLGPRQPGTGRATRFRPINGRRTPGGHVMRTGFATRFRARGVLALGLGMVCAAVWTGDAAAQDAGRVKTVKGTVYIERGGGREVALVGSGVRQADTLVTGPDGAVGVTLADDTLLSAGPNSVLVIERFVYEANQPGSV